MPSSVTFVDPHIHLWDLATGWYPLLSEKTEDEAHGVGPFGKLQGNNFLLPDYFKHAEGYSVKKVVHVTAAQAPPAWPEETRFLQDMFEAHGHPHGIIGWTDFDRPLEQVDAELAEHAQYPNFRGIRHQTVVDYRSDHVGECFRLMQRRGLIYDVVAHEDSLPHAAAAAKRFPDMTFVLEHTGWPSGPEPDVFDAWRAGINQFATAPNTAVKISGLGMPLRGFDIAQVAPWVDATIEAFGPDRCMFASNFPVDWLFTEYSTLIEGYLSLTDSYSADEREAMFVRNAERWYRI
jgi:L-fuconolactonase